MAITKKRSNSDEDFLNVAPDATATFDNSRSNPTEHASSENLDAVDTEEEDEDGDEDDDEDDDDDEADEDDHDLGKGPKAPSVYRKI